jgi:hypothetical protein
VRVSSSLLVASVELVEPFFVLLADKEQSGRCGHKIGGLLVDGSYRAAKFGEFRLVRGRGRLQRFGAGQQELQPGVDIAGLRVAVISAHVSTLIQPLDFVEKP